VLIRTSFNCGFVLDGSGHETAVVEEGSNITARARRHPLARPIVHAAHMPVMMTYHAPSAMMLSRQFARNPNHKSDHQDRSTRCYIEFCDDGRYSAHAEFTRVTTFIAALSHMIPNAPIGFCNEFGDHTHMEVKVLTSYDWS
jgi:hypothetical protein